MKHEFTYTSCQEPVADCKRHGFMSHDRECPYCKEESRKRAIDAAVSVIKAASIGDQNFIPCLRGECQQTTRLRLAIVELAERLRDC